jgi:hypothetical protein
MFQQVRSMRLSKGEGDGVECKKKVYEIDGRLATAKRRTKPV